MQEYVDFGDDADLTQAADGKHLPGNCCLPGSLGGLACLWGISETEHPLQAI